MSATHNLLEGAEKELFELQEHGEVLVLRFTQREGLAGTDPGVINELWHFFEQRSRRARGAEPPEIPPPKVLLLDVPQGLLSTKNADVFWKDQGFAQDPSGGSAFSRETAYDASQNIAREEIALHRFIGYVRAMDSVLLLSFSKEKFVCPFWV